MNQPGWTMEQRAGIKRYFTLATIAVACGTMFAVFLIVSGNTGGWALLALLLAPWALTYVYLRNVAKAQP
ncbi:hypothetical protein [Streptomyces sp. LN699]|uniref:hypothetical protein n=1 Tax=Streptomyces sp. LN699 TaxID=3112981 RepID=UPI003711EB2E